MLRGFWRYRRLPSSGGFVSGFTFGGGVGSGVTFGFPICSLLITSRLSVGFTLSGSVSSLLLGTSIASSSSGLFSCIHALCALLLIFFCILRCLRFCCCLCCCLRFCCLAHSFSKLRLLASLLLCLLASNFFCLCLRWALLCLCGWLWCRALTATAKEQFPLAAAGPSSLCLCNDTRQFITGLCLLLWGL